MKLILAGASGLVGGHVLRQADTLGHEVLLVGRRPIEDSDREIITDFSEPPALPTADAAICALGTTIARAGSRKAFYAVDHDAVLAFASGAREAGVSHFLVVTAVGADPRATVYYSRVKGEVERDLQDLGFERIDIAQPGLLLGPRDERRPVESFLQAADPVLRCLMVGPMGRYAGIDAGNVARAFLVLCESARQAGVFRYQNRDLQQLARSQ